MWRFFHLGIRAIPKKNHHAKKCAYMCELASRAKANNKSCKYFKSQQQKSIPISIAQNKRNCRTGLVERWQKFWLKCENKCKRKMSNMKKKKKRQFFFVYISKSLYFCKLASSPNLF